ncbi:MAG: flagellar biosynthetic protein FliR [Myxococcales bacterium]|nr:flagellar biosynthetic protein FliR [Myxococcales bacterium]
MSALVEVVMGLMAGLLLRVVIESFTFGGEMAGDPDGPRVDRFFNPLDTQITLLGSAFTFLALGLFATGDGPLHLMAFLSRWLELVPVAGSQHFGGIFEVAATAGSELFRLALSAAAPMIAAVFCAQVILGVLARALPTLNLLVEGPSLTLSAGILGMFASVHTYGSLLSSAFDGRVDQLFGWWGV